MSSRPNHEEKTRAATLLERRRGRSSAQRWSSLVRLGLAWSLGLAFLFGLTLQSSAPIDDLLLDSAQVNGGRWYDGMVTSLGVLAWTVSATACAAAGYASRVAARRGAERTLITGAALITLLLLDDLFLLHSNVLPRVLGGSKLTFVSLEALLVSGWVALGVRELRRTRWELLVASGTSLGASVLIDLFNPFGLDAVTRLVLEDGAKFLGLLALAVWASSTAADLIRSVARGSIGEQTDAHSSQPGALDDVTNDMSRDAPNVKDLTERTGVGRSL